VRYGYHTIKVTEEKAVERSVLPKGCGPVCPVVTGCNKRAACETGSDQPIDIRFIAMGVQHFDTVHPEPSGQKHNGSKVPPAFAGEIEYLQVLTFGLLDKTRTGWT
jgi:hypothetical protein